MLQTKSNLGLTKRLSKILTLAMLAIVTAVLLQVSLTRVDAVARKTRLNKNVFSITILASLALVSVGLTPSVTLATVTTSAPLYSISPRDDILRIVDPATGGTIDDSVVITLSGETVGGGTGLAQDPTTGSPPSGLAFEKGGPRQERSTSKKRTKNTAARFVQVTSC